MSHGLFEVFVRICFTFFKCAHCEGPAAAEMLDCPNVQMPESKYHKRSFDTTKLLHAAAKRIRVKKWHFPFVATIAPPPPPPHPPQLIFQKKIRRYLCASKQPITTQIYSAHIGWKLAALLIIRRREQNVQMAAADNMGRLWYRLWPWKVKCLGNYQHESPLRHLI